MDEKNIIDSLTIDNKTKQDGVETLISEYRKVEIFKFYESEFVALEIIKTTKNPEKLKVDNGVTNFSGYVY